MGPRVRGDDVESAVASRDADREIIACGRGGGGSEVRGERDLSD